MREDDVVPVHDLSVAVFEDLARRLHDSPPPHMGGAAAHLRLRHLLAIDPAGCWVAEAEDGSLAGVAVAIVREGVWGLSLLVVDPGVQSGGLGSALLRRSLAYGVDARGGIILASPDSRALRASAALLRTVLARMPARAGAEVEWLTSAQDWAIDVVVDARLRLRPGGRCLPARRHRAVPALPARRRLPLNQRAQPLR